MRNFLKLATNVDVSGLLAALARHPELWNVNSLRTLYPGTPHSEVDDIWIRFNALPDVTMESVLDDHESTWYPAVHVLPQVRPLLFALMRQVEGERLGRVLITRLRPGARIAPHVDGGRHAEYYSRHHVVLQGLPGSLFRAGDETVCMQTGEVWWFDNSKEHECTNNSADDRIHMVVDIKTL